MKKLKDYKLNEKNPRFIKDSNFEKLCNSIKEHSKFMELRPIIVDENNIILGGNMRYRALKELGYKEVQDTWIKQASELTDKEKQAFIVKDNVGFGDWDYDMLANDWDTQNLQDWGLDLPDFNITEINEKELWEDADISEFEEAEKQIKMILIFETEEEREIFLKKENLEINRKMNNQWIVKI